MTIQQDIEALEKALDELQSARGFGKCLGLAARFTEACSPDRIRRLLDAFEHTDAEAASWRRLCKASEAKLSKAIEMLKEPGSTRQEIITFLREAGHE